MLSARRQAPGTKGKVGKLWYLRNKICLKNQYFEPFYPEDFISVLCAAIEAPKKVGKH